MTWINYRAMLCIVQTIMLSKDNCAEHAVDILSLPDNAIVLTKNHYALRNRCMGLAYIWDIKKIRDFRPVSCSYLGNGSR